MKAVNIQFNIETLEDFHIGTGLDCIGLYDDGQVKDKEGNPYINTETLKGLLKQSCLEVTRNLKGFKDTFNEIFRFKNLGSLDLTITYQGCDSGSPFIIHMFTAIDKKRGTSKKGGTLHDIEFGSKGCTFKVELHFEMKNDGQKETVKELLKLGIKNLKWMGSYRRRGFGAIRCKQIKEGEAKSDRKEIIQNKKIRIFLELMDNACFAGAGQTEKNIHSLDYITATSAQGMLRNPLLKMKKDTTLLDDGNIAVTNFYPICHKKDWQDEIKRRVVIPVPASLRKNKSVNQYADYYRTSKTDNAKLEIPHWALEAKPVNGDKKSFQNIVNQDTLIDDKEGDQQSFSHKRISGQYLIYKDNKLDLNDAVFYKPMKKLMMRNRIKHTTQSAGKAAIFTQEMLEKGTIFVGEITFNNVEDSENFQAQLQDWLSGKYCFHAGRGAKPIKVIAIEEVPGFPKITNIQDDEKHFTLTLLSDAILYDKKLMPETVIHPEYLDLDIDVKNKVKLVNSVASNRIHQSFSGTAGLRRFSDRVISKGSCFLYELQDGIKLKDIQEDLRKIQQNGIGYKKDEGFGQVLINLSVHQKTKEDIPKASYNFDIDEAKHAEFIETNLEKSDENFEKSDKLLESAKIQKITEKSFSKTFINRIIAYMESNYNEDQIFKEIEHGKKTSSAKKWKDFEKIYYDENLEQERNKNEIIKIAFTDLKNIK